MKARGLAKPYPWGQLEAVSADDAAAIRALGRWARGTTTVGAIAPALGAILEEKVAFLVKRTRTGKRVGRTLEDGIAVILAGADTADERGGEVLVEVDGALAARVLAAVIKRPSPKVVAPGKVALSTAGVVAAVSAATFRRAHAGRALRVVAAGPGAALENDFARSGRGLVEVRFTVLVKDDAFDARVLVRREVSEGASEASFRREDLRRLGDVGLAIPVVAAASWSTAAEVGSLRRGDVWLPGTARLGIAGKVTLVAPGEESGLRAMLGDDGRIVLGDGIEALAGDASADASGRSMDGENDTQRDALAEAVGEVPVVVRVEIGSVELRAREWAALGAGDVVALGKRVGEGVTLRVGGVTVARGELVDIDGEVGVRVLGRTEGS